MLLDLGHLGLPECEVIICPAAAPLLVRHDKGKGDVLITVRGRISADNIPGGILVPVHESIGIIVVCFINP
jgi:hypothetical protein